MLQQQEVARRQWELLAAGMLERYQLRLGRWCPPTVGVRDPRAGWVLTSTLVEILTDPDIRLRVTRADALTGVTVARDPSVYRPNAALAQRSETEIGRAGSPDAPSPHGAATSTMSCATPTAPRAKTICCACAAPTTVSSTMPAGCS